MKNFDSRLFVYDCTSAIAPPAGPAEANLLRVHPRAQDAHRT